MWSTVWSRSLGDMPVRQITLFALAILMALLTGITTNPALAQESDSQQITGTEENITYASKTYSKLDPIPKSDPTFETSACGAPTIASAYIRFNRPEPDLPAIGAEVICSKDFTAGEAIIVVFPNAQVAAGSNQVSSFGTITTSERDDIVAIQKRYGLKGLPSSGVSESQVVDSSVALPAVAGDRDAYQALYEKFSANIQHENPITVGGSSPGDSGPTTSCSGDNTRGIGWLICPATNWIASAMDALYEILEGFLTVGPLSTNRDSAMYYVWGLMRNIANILFILGFLIIIYSQITTVGLSNYGIKRLLPRLVIAAVLVNTSYWVVALAVDISNILGVTLQDLFVDIRKNMPVSENINMQMEDITWNAVSGALLSGGAAGIVIGGAVMGATASAGASLYLLIPVIMGAIVAALVAILVLAARQALITILIIISPLAFVAYLLPSTEKYFDRWRGLLTTLLLVFPAFALVFGGAQLAGMAIIAGALDNPGSENFFNVIILGMAVQVAPLIITPLLVKLSGSLIGRIAGIVNDPNRGMIDRSRNFAQERHDMRKFSQISKKNADGSYAHNNPLARAARWKAIRDKDKESRLKTYQSGVDSAYAKDRRSHEAHSQSAINEMIKTEGDNTAKAEFAESIRSTVALRNQYYQSEFSSERAATESSRNKTEFEGLKADPDIVATNAIEREIGRRARQTNEMAKNLAHRENAAKIVQEKNYNEMLAADKDTQLFAGYDDIDPYGATRVSNIGEEAEYKARETRIAAGNATLGRGDATVDELVGIVTNNATLAGRYAEFAKDADNRSAAVRRLFDTAPKFAIQEVTETLDLSKNVPPDSVEAIIRSEVAAAMSKRKPFYVSQTRRGEIAEGRLEPSYLHESGRNQMIKETLNQAGLDAEIMVTADREELEAVIKYFQKHGVDSIKSEAKASLTKALDTAFNDTHYSGRMGKSRTELNQLRSQLGLPRID